MLELQGMLVDTHAHLMDPAFDPDLDAVLARAREASVGAIVCVGYDLASSAAAVALASQRPGLYATVGVHPNYLAEAPPDWVARLRALAEAPRVVGIGETGLDYYRTYTPPGVQRTGLSEHLALAAERHLPVVIHCREAEADLLAVLAERPSSRPELGVLHCFSGSAATMRAAVDAGYYISLAGSVTFKSARDRRAVAGAVPSARLLVETDAPYLSPVPRRGQRNEPAHVQFTAACVADVRGQSPAEVAQMTTDNAVRLFRLPAEAMA
jgi:TatD DNase family protein